MKREKHFYCTQEWMSWVTKAQSNAAWILEKHEDHTICLSGKLRNRVVDMLLCRLGMHITMEGVLRETINTLQSPMCMQIPVHSQAMYNLGSMHEYGLGLPYDLRLAKHYYDEVLENDPIA